MQLLGERLDVALRDRAKQDQFEQLVVGERRRRRPREIARLQSLAMAE